jgi:anti-sigma-K factor RskA
MVKTMHPLNLLPGYAIGALSESEKAEITAHLHTCNTCRKVLAEYETTVTKLSLATPIQKAPARIKTNLMSQVRRQSSSSKVALSNHWWKALFANPAYAAASLLAILALAASNIWLWNKLQQKAEPPAPVTETIQLENTGKVASGLAMLVISDDGLHATLIVEQLTQLTPEQQYQLWLIEDGQLLSAGVFTVSRDGYYALPISSQIAFDSYSAFGVSVEPFGGSPAPTGDIVFYIEQGA